MTRNVRYAFMCFFIAVFMALLAIVDGQTWKVTQYLNVITGFAFTVAATIYMLKEDE